MPETSGKRAVFSGSGISVETSGAERERTNNDWYPTGDDTVEAIYIANPPEIPKDRRYIMADPGMGTGPFGRMLRKLYPRDQYPLLEIWGFELDERFDLPPEYDRLYRGNFLTDPGVEELIAAIGAGDEQAVDFWAGNPPYELDTEFFAQCLRMVNPQSGRIDLLYRLGFAASEDRAFDWYMRGYKASLMTVCNTRPCFLPLEEQAAKGKGTYPGDFSIFSWQFAGGKPDQAGRFAHLVYETCTACGRVFIPEHRRQRQCPEHDILRLVELAPINLAEYVAEGWRGFVNKEVRRAEKLAQSGKAEERQRGAEGLERWMPEAIKLGLRKAAAVETVELLAA